MLENGTEKNEDKFKVLLDLDRISGKSIAVIGFPILPQINSGYSLSYMQQSLFENIFQRKIERF